MVSRYICSETINIQRADGDFFNLSKNLISLLELMWVSLFFLPSSNLLKYGAEHHIMWIDGQKEEISLSKYRS